MSEPPRISRMTNVAWGLLAVPCTLVVAVLLAGPATGC